MVRWDSAIRITRAIRRKYGDHRSIEISILDLTSLQSPLGAHGVSVAL